MKAVVEATRMQLENEYREAGNGVKLFPRLANGLVTDEAKASVEYKSAKARMDKAFSALRAFNAKFKR